MVHENEQLKSRGETQLATQWRDRYELCSQEKEELIEQIKMMQACSGTSPNSLERGGSPSSHQNNSTRQLSNSNDSFSLERAYMQLKEEYKVSLLSFPLSRPHSSSVSSSRQEFRRKVMALEQEREKKRERRRHEHHEPAHSNGDHYFISSNATHQSISPMETSKLQYLRNLILQYLSCKDPILRDHMENAIVTIFRYNDKERQAIFLRKQEESGSDGLFYSSITSIVNNLSGVSS
jgi:hypothetical protein